MNHSYLHLLCPRNSLLGSDESQLFVFIVSTESLLGSDESQLFVFIVSTEFFIGFR